MARRWMTLVLASCSLFLMAVHGECVWNLDIEADSHLTCDKDDQAIEAR